LAPSCLRGHDNNRGGTQRREGRRKEGERSRLSLFLFFRVSRVARRRERGCKRRRREVGKGERKKQRSRRKRYIFHSHPLWTAPRALASDSLERDNARKEGRLRTSPRQRSPGLRTILAAAVAMQRKNARAKERKTEKDQGDKGGKKGGRESESQVFIICHPMTGQLGGRTFQHRPIPVGQWGTGP